MSDAETTIREESSAVTTERRGLPLITLNRPEVRNAVNAAARRRHRRRAGRSRRRRLPVGRRAHRRRGLLLRGHGPRRVRQAASRPGSATAASPASPSAPRVKPLIAAIEGFAVAGGLEVALACDLIVAARGAKLGIPEAKRSLVAAGGALLRLPRRMPYHVVMELALTGDPLPAERFHELGVVNRLAEPGSAVEVALELAGASPTTGRSPLIATKLILQEQFDWSSSEMWERQGAISGPVLTSEDAHEGAAAFKEKRDPIWRGR